MKKLLLILGLLITGFINAQVPAYNPDGYKAPLIYHEGQTTTELDALSLGSGDRVIAYDSTLGKYRSWNGTAWEDFGSVFTPTDLLTDYGFTDNSNNWDIAFGWGDHSTAGYASLLNANTWSGLNTFQFYSDFQLDIRMFGGANINMSSGGRIIGLADGINTNDAVNKSQLDTAISGFVSNPMTGALDANSNWITNLPVVSSSGNFEVQSGGFITLTSDNDVRVGLDLDNDQTDSEFFVTKNNEGEGGKVFSVYENGDIDFYEYGSGTKTGTATYNLAVDASGNVIEEPLGGGTGDVTAASNITDNAVVRGDGGAKGVQESGVLIDDSDNITGVNGITANTFTGDGSSLTGVGDMSLSGVQTITGEKSFEENLVMNTNWALRFGDDGSGPNSAISSLFASLSGGMTWRLYDGDFKIRDGSTFDRFTFGRTTGDFTATGDVTANTYNGVALTTAGSSTNFLNEQGNYVSNASDFISNSDTPGSYTSQAGKFAKVNATEDALIFTTAFDVYDDSPIFPTFWAGTQAQYDVKFPSGHASTDFVIITDATPPELTASDITDFDTEVSNNTDVTANTAKVSYTDASKVANITVTQAVDLDQMEADVASNNAKVTNATHTGEVTGSTTLTLDPTSVSNKTLKSSLTGAEEVLINDTTLKKTTTQDIADLAAASSSSPVLEGNWYMGTGINRYYYVKTPGYSFGSDFYQTSATNVPIFEKNSVTGFAVVEDKTITAIKGVITATSEFDVTLLIVSKHQEFIDADLDITTATTTLTSSTYTFVSGDAGKDIVVPGAGSAGGNLITTIASFTNANEVELTDAASTTVSGANGSLETNTVLYTSSTITTKPYAPVLIDLSGLDFDFTAGDRIFIVNQSAVSVTSLELSLKLYE